jgi:CD36 family
LKLDYTIDGYQFDDYSFILSRWGHKALNNAITQLRADVFWAVHARNLFGYYYSKNATCPEIIQASGVTTNLSISVCSQFGWDISDPSTWEKLVPWIVAASNSENSTQYSQLLQLTQIDEESFKVLIKTNISADLSYIESYISGYYNCSRKVCYYDEMVWIQWSSSMFTNNLTIYLQNLTPSLTIYTWLPRNYAQPFEWPNYSNLHISIDLAMKLINYDMFLAPYYVRSFFNNYFTGNVSRTASKFGIPTEYVYDFYIYFQKIVPGSGLFYTASYSSWVQGFVHPFLLFMYETNIFEGGNPLSYPIYALGANSSDLPSTPKTVMYSGKGDVDKTRIYYEYYGKKYITDYGASLCVFCPHALSYANRAIWPTDIMLTSADGGKFQNNLDKGQSLTAFITILYKNVKLAYVDSGDYYGLPVYTYYVDPNDLENSTIVPENANYSQFGIYGFYNLSSVYGFPFFESKPNYYGCDPITQNMTYFYEYDPVNPLSTQIFPDVDDEPYVVINPQTGASVELLFKLMGSVVIHSDYYFNYIAQPAGDIGIHIPYYTITRHYKWTESMINKHFGALIEAFFLQDIFFYLGLLAGAFFLQIGFILAVSIKRYKRRTHQKRISLAIREKVDGKDKVTNNEEIEEEMIIESD